MLKKIIIVLISLILIGCNDTDNAEKNLKAPEFILREIYRENTDILLNDVILCETDYVLLVDASIYNENVLNLVNGTYKLDAYAYDENGNRSDVVEFTLTIVGDKDYYSDVYNKPDLDSELLTLSRNNTLEYLYSEERKLEVVDGTAYGWYKVKTASDEIGYVFEGLYYTNRKSEFDKYTFICESGKKIELEKNIYYYEYNPDFIGLGLLIFNYKKDELSADNRLIVSIVNGESIVIDGKLTLIDDKSKLMSYMKYNSYNGILPYKIQIIDINNRNLDLIFEKEYVDLGVEKIVLENENTLSIKRIIKKDNNWNSTNFELIDVYVKIIYDGVNWIEEEKKKEIIYTEEILTIYSELDEKSDIYGEIDIRETEKVEFLKTFEIINNNLVLWFEVIFRNGDVGYTFRSELEGESLTYPLIEDFYFIYPDGEVKTQIAYAELRPNYVVKNDLASAGFFTEFIIYEEISGNITSIHNKSSKYIGGFPIPSNKKTRFLIPWNIGYSDILNIGIFKIDGNDIITEYEYTSNEWYIDSVEWIDEETVSFTKRYKGATELGEVECKLIFINNEWIMEDTK